MNAVERWAMKDDKASSCLFLAIGLAVVVYVVLLWANPTEETTLTGQIIGSVVGVIGAVMFGGVGLYGFYMIGVVQGAHGWHDGHELQTFTKKVQERRTKLEAKLR